MKAGAKKAVFDRDGHRCRFCNATDDLTVDHIYPRSKGGSNTLSNLQTLCRSCNEEKADKVPEGSPRFASFPAPSRKVIRRFVRPRMRMRVEHHSHCTTDLCSCLCPIWLAEHPQFALGIWRV